MSLEDFLVQEADITAEAPDGQAPAQDALGGADRSGDWLPVAGGVPCLVRPMTSTLSARQSARDDARRNVVDARIYFGEGLPAVVPGGITTRHRITVAGAVYAPTGTIDPNSMGRLYQVDCERVRTP